MRIDILAIGSDGDVRPSVALGLGLQREGHQVRVVALNGFDDLVGGNGLDYLAIGVSPRDIASSSQGREWVGRRASTFGFMRGFVAVARSLIETGIKTYVQSCQGVELLVVNSIGLGIGVHIAEQLGIPLIRTHTSPFAPTRYDWARRKTLGTMIRGDLRTAAGAAFRTAIWMMLRGTTNRVRAEVLQLRSLPLNDPFGALDRRRIPALDAYSPTVVARPPDWGDWIHVTGYWFLDDAPGWTPPPPLAEFLASGPAPVFVGFGSTPFPNPDAATELIVAALSRAEQRGIIVSGGSGLSTGRLNRDVLSIDSVPHGWLFPQMSAAVHHGGAGVTGAALRAGLPSVVVPVFADQPFWGSRVFELGAGPRPIPAKQLTVEALASALERTGTAAMRDRAASLGERIRTENGVTRAVEAIHRHVGAAPAARRAS